MTKVNYSKLFKEAHAEARRTVEEVGDYMIAFSLALKTEWKEIKSNDNTLNDDKIAKLEKAGWSRWTKYGYDRLYFNAEENGVLYLTYYKTGNISYASFDDEKISNSQGYRLLSVKCYIDLKDYSFHCSDSEAGEMIEKVAKRTIKEVAQG